MIVTLWIVGLARRVGGADRGDRGLEAVATAEVEGKGRGGHTHGHDQLFAEDGLDLRLLLVLLLPRGSPCRNLHAPAVFHFLCPSYLRAESDAPQ